MASQSRVKVQTTQAADEIDSINHSTTCLHYSKVAVMRLGARMKAAVEVLDEIHDQHQPAANALKDWGRSHRFAGSGDRAAIATIVYDALRSRSSLAHQMDSDQSRALVLAATLYALEIEPSDLANKISDAEYGLEPLTEAECAALKNSHLPHNTPTHIRANIPAWLESQFERSFGERTAIEGAALSKRAPTDLRVNALKATREKVINKLARHHAQHAPLSPLGVRIPIPQGLKRAPNIEVETAHGKGWYEIQDAASQVASIMAGAGPRMQVLDLCAGSGGKTLAMAAQMQNTGQIFAYDKDKHQLRPIFERVRRAGVRNLQVLTAGDKTALQDMQGRFDVVLVDAPCTGSGTWRRRPDAKWRLTETHLQKRLAEQVDVLDFAAPLPRVGGQIVYVTCSLLTRENTDQVQDFLKKHPNFEFVPYAINWTKHLGGSAPESSDGREDGLLLTPAQHDTDGFYIACLKRTV